MLEKNEFATTAVAVVIRCESAKRDGVSGGVRILVLVLVLATIDEEEDTNAEQREPA